MMGNIYKLSDFYLVHWIQQRKSHNIKSDIRPSSRTPKQTKKQNSKTKKIILCKIPSHKWIKGNEEADKAAKQVIHLPEMTTTQTYIDYLLPDHQESYKLRMTKWVAKRS